MKRITTVIVNYRLRDMLEQTLLSVRDAQAEVGGGDIIVVDNASGDGSVDALSSLFDDVTWIRNNENVGFGRANNQAIAMAKTEFVLILNPDTVISADNLRECLKLMDKDERCGCIGVKMLDADGRFHPESKRGFPTVKNAFCKLFGLARIFSNCKWAGGYNLRYLSTDETHKVPVLAGAYMFARRDVLKKIGGFDEDFFMYGEDIDLSYRITAAGYDNYYLPTPMIHYKGECTKTDSIRYVRTFYEAMSIFYRKHYPHSGFVARLLVKGGIWVRMSAQAIRNVMVKPLLKTLKKEKRSTHVVIVSQQPKEVEEAILKRDMPTADVRHVVSLSDLHLPAGRATIVIDDRSMGGYGAVIDFIAMHYRKGIHYYIYMSSRHALMP